MIRKMLAAATAVAMILVGVLSLNAGANTNCGGYYFGGATNDCADAVAYGGPFTNMPAAPTGPYGWGSLNVVAGAASGGTGGGDAGAALAHTGSESTVIAYVGTGMIAFGAVALGSRRKFFQGALD
jgi:LPXTG-motif cell wall-anchored protein